MIQTETSKAKIIFVSVPNDAFNYEMNGADRLLWYNESEQDFQDLPQGNWTILNVLDDVTEDEAEIVLHEYTFGLYANYLSKKRIRFSSAVKSLHSLATSLGVEGKTIILYELK